MRHRLRRVFPRHWWSLYGADFEADFGRDRRTVSKWFDLARTLGPLWWREGTRTGRPAGVAMALALVVSTVADAALGVGLDERFGIHLGSHWWGAPFVVAAVLCGALAAAATGAVVHDRRRRRWLLAAIVALAGSAFVASAIGATVAARGAAVGAGIGLVAGVALVRLCIKAGPDAADLALGVSALAAVALGWRTASTPVGPAVLIVCVGAALASRVPQQEPNTSLG
jgi:hypothetical protein